MTRTRRTVFPLLLLCSVLALAACGTGSGSGSDPDPSPSVTDFGYIGSSPPAGPPSSAAPAAAPVSLTVGFKADGTATSSTWTLLCDGAEPLDGSTVPDAAAACALLAEQGAAALAEPAPDQMCTQQIRGMQRAHVTGTVNGEAVDTTFSLTDGCQISRWERLTALLGPADGAL
ncbi:hypothetical protein [Arthrobacter yangruifuii]|uniref:hypothetical protein n=1 Tax=Arthrobacter yangruifuii TaxID=2606616 RepID=UPI001884BDE0|nr:hypothetical protein [Arthrobacter yangruifuii]